MNSNDWETGAKEDRPRRDTAQGVKEEANCFKPKIRTFDTGATIGKSSNPKDAVGIRKAPMSTLPAPVLFEIGLAMMEGARKYGRHNYRAVGVRASVYYDAFMRHVAAWWEGEDVDPDSGLPHLSKAAACLVVLRDSMRRGNCTDDRPPKVEDGWLKDLNKLAAELIDRCPEAKEPFVEKNSAELRHELFVKHPWLAGKESPPYQTHCPNCSRLPQECVCSKGQSEYKPVHGDFLR